MSYDDRKIYVIISMFYYISPLKKKECITPQCNHIPKHVEHCSSLHKIQRKIECLPLFQLSADRHESATALDK